MTAPGRRLAIVATGQTMQGEHPGRSAASLAVEALGNAIDSIGITKDRINGLISCKQLHGDGMDSEVAPLAGLQLDYSTSLHYGTCNFSLHQAQFVLDAGLADVVALTYGTNQRTNRYPFGNMALGASAFTTPYGFTHIAGEAGMAFQRWRHLYGTTEEQLAHIAVSQRAWAQKNPISIFTQPLTHDDYMAQPYLVEPLRRADITMISDGGVAYIVTTEEKAYEFTDKPVILAGMAESGASPDYYGDNFLRPWIAPVGQRIWENAGIDRSEVDAVYVQDPTAVWPLQMLSYYGFAHPGDIGDWLDEKHTYPGGDLPVNTNGGQLSEAYMWGWLHIVEAVRQLRGEAGERQIDNARVALYASTQAFVKAASSILVRA
ncbi:thiolase [Frondihabitans sucicola]|uniref:Thiolase n=1 Tax=Frondihabitans sucicola TaxID=1268041 RepID=A0ABN6Y301_9MICO|nr:thiolase family protein [Frondihabitans sucicola]BDZ51441.1 thiolase [Frondihabitans sucicola]